MISNDKKINLLFLQWLIVGFSLVFLMVIVGGLTRLTNSGLSITQWELFRGILPPLSSASWQNYFNLYKEIPQFKILNPDMNLAEFKIIFYWEYFHRILGRIIGLFFLIPLIYFHFSNKIIKNLKAFYVILFLIILQGIIGWYMVKSGLTNDVTVSHYRLSVHLGMAIIIISIIFWQILSIKNNSYRNFFKISFKNISYFLLIALLFLQIMSGALVSGLDAGRIYQTWPLMGENFFPDDINTSNFINYLELENHSLVQFYHRNLAYLISIYILILVFFVFLNKKKDLYYPVIILSILLLFQILLGIFTLLSGLNILLAAAHQISSMLLILSALNLYFFAIK